MNKIKKPVGAIIMGHTHNNPIDYNNQFEQWREVIADAFKVDSILLGGRRADKHVEHVQLDEWVPSRARLVAHFAKKKGLFR